MNTSFDADLILLRLLIKLLLPLHYFSKMFPGGEKHVPHVPLEMIMRLTYTSWGLIEELKVNLICTRTIFQSEIKSELLESFCAEPSSS